MTSPPLSPEREISFGPFRLFPAQQLLLEGATPVRLGSRAFDILTVLVERSGELVSKAELFALVWPNTLVSDNALRVHVAGLRKALGDNHLRRQYLANIPGRGYRFLVPITISEPEKPLAQHNPLAEHAHNIPVSRSSVLGRSEVIHRLLEQLPKLRFVTVVGSGGIGKTAVALALAEALLPSYKDGVRFVDLAPITDPQLVLKTLGSAFGLAADEQVALSQLTEFLQDKQALIVLDSCEHVVAAAACLAEQLLNSAAGIHILATSREPLRAEGERVHRLAPLETPDSSTDLSPAAALAFPAIGLFVERAAAIMDGFELCDADAPIVADICRKLGGMPLAIELAAARVDAFSMKELAVLLDDQFRILNHGRRTAQPRHRSLDAMLDWSYELLSETERVLLRRLSIFASAFTLDAAVALGGDSDMDMIDGIANLVAKSLVSADMKGAIVQYQLLDTTRAYLQRKLIGDDEFRRLSQSSLTISPEGAVARLKAFQDQRTMSA